MTAARYTGNAEGALLASFFVRNDDAPVSLIETSRSSPARRRVVTEDLLKSYIEHDFDVPISACHPESDCPDADRNLQVPKVTLTR